MPYPLDRDKTQELCDELDGVMAAHLTWFKQLNRILVCGCEQAGSDVGLDSYLNSPLGRWYAAHKRSELSEHAAFQELEVIQQAMYEAARLAIEAVRAGGRPSVQMYDRCIDLSLKINSRLRQMQLEIITELLATDALTGCYSQRCMIDRLQAEQERAGRIQRPCSLCLLDFDAFAQINDEFGQPAGDVILKQAMRYVANVLRKYDSVFRYEGDAFLLCLPGTPLPDAAHVIERLRAGLEKLPIVLPMRQKVHVTASFGLAEIELGKPVEDFIERTRTALTRARQQGGNRVEIWRPESGFNA